MKARILKDSLPGLREYAGLLVKAALAEDIGSGDITTEPIVPAAKRGEAEIIAREDLVLAGLFMAEDVFKRLDSMCVFKANYKDGQAVKKGAVIATVKGRLRALLQGERVALNFIQRLSGIATLSDEFVKRAKSAAKGASKVRILDTRKTTPCLRLLEKYAVRAGGGYNHRFGLFDAILIKDNHIKAAGSIKKAVDRVNKRYRGGALVEVEASTFEEVRESLDAGADIIMLDNFTPEKIKKALRMIKGGALVEASGGVTLENISRYAATGVNFVSVGALTHSVRAVDISMEVK